MNCSAAGARQNFHSSGREPCWGLTLQKSSNPPKPALPVLPAMSLYTHSSLPFALHSLPSRSPGIASTHRSALQRPHCLGSRNSRSSFGHTADEGQTVASEAEHSPFPPWLAPSLAAAAAGAAGVAVTVAVATGFSWPWPEILPSDASTMSQLLAVSICAYGAGAATAAAMSRTKGTHLPEDSTKNHSQNPTLSYQNHLDFSKLSYIGSSENEAQDQGLRAVSPQQGSVILTESRSSIDDGPSSALPPSANSMEPFVPEDQQEQSSPTPADASWTLLESWAQVYQALLEQDSTWMAPSRSTSTADSITLGTQSKVEVKETGQRGTQEPRGLPAIREDAVEDEEWRMAGEVWGKQPELLLQGLRVRDRQRLLWSACTALLDQVGSIPVSAAEVDSSTWAELCKDALLRSTRECALQWMLQQQGPASSDMSLSTSAPSESEALISVLLGKVWDDGRGALYQDLIEALRFPGQQRGPLVLSGNRALGTGKLQALAILTPQPGVLPKATSQLTDPPAISPSSTLLGDAGVMPATDGLQLKSSGALRRRLVGGGGREEVQMGLVMDDVVVVVAEIALEALLQGWGRAQGEPEVERFFCDALQSTRAMARFRNEVALSKWLHWNFGAVSDLVADRCPLWTIDSPRSVKKDTSYHSTQVSALRPEAGVQFAHGIGEQAIVQGSGSMRVISDSFANPSIGAPTQARSKADIWDPLQFLDSQADVLSEIQTGIAASSGTSRGRRRWHRRRRRDRRASAGRHDGDSVHLYLQEDGRETRLHSSSAMAQKKASTGTPVSLPWPGIVGAVLTACISALGLPHQRIMASDRPANSEREIRHEVPQQMGRADVEEASKGMGSSAMLRVTVQYVSLRRTREELLKALTGWRLMLCLWLELTDLFGPLVRRAFQGVSRWLSFVLVSLIGQTLGLIFKGMKTSFKYS